MQKGLQFTTMFTEVNFFCRKVTLDVVVQGQFHQALSSMPRLLAVSTTTCALLQEYTIQIQVFVQNGAVLKKKCSFKTRMLRIRDVYLGSPIIHPRSWIQQQKIQQQQLFI
jgi:hypothetical protein